MTVNRSEGSLRYQVLRQEGENMKTIMNDELVTDELISEGDLYAGFSNYQTPTEIQLLHPLEYEQFI